MTKKAKCEETIPQGGSLRQTRQSGGEGSQLPDGHNKDYYYIARHKKAELRKKTQGTDYDA